MMKIIFALLGLISVAYCLKCNVGSTQYGKLTAPQSGTINCSGKCYVMHNNYDDDKWDSWIYGCLIKANEGRCGTTTATAGGKYEQGYCCCDSDQCNDKDFADDECSSSVMTKLSILAFLPLAAFIAMFS